MPSHPSHLKDAPRVDSVTQLSRTANNSHQLGSITTNFYHESSVTLALPLKQQGYRRYSIATRIVTPLAVCVVLPAVGNLLDFAAVTLITHLTIFA